MTSKSMRIVIVAAVVVASARVSVEANAQCCGAPATAYYQPAVYTAYSPVAYQTYRAGWYPGYFLDQIRTRLWGSPSTYVAAYPSTYVASYPSAYAASYPSSYVASYAPSYSAGYAPSYSPCTSCAPVQQVTMRPMCCTSAYTPPCDCDPCSSCASCGTSGVSQASYQSGGCASCGVGTTSGATIVIPNSTEVTPGTEQSTPSNGYRQPELAPGEQIAPERTFQRPVNGDQQQDVQPEPGSDSGDAELERVPEGDGAESSTFFEPPKLFNPNDRTARRSIDPVRTAIYQQDVSHMRVSAQRKINAQQAQRDAAGWVSASR
jgi:hypothetical protein